MIKRSKKVALVTGSSKGIGNNIADTLLANNYIVYINGRNLTKLKTQKKYINKSVKFIQADLCSEKYVKSTLRKILKNEGQIDLIVANIGDGKYSSKYDFNIKDFYKIFEINFFSSVLVSRHAIDYMKKEKGHIIFVSSIAGCESLPAPIAYSAAKTALLSYSKNLANEVAKYNIRINTISPGNVMFKGSTWDKKYKINKNAIQKYIKNNVPLNCFIEPNDISQAVIFLENSKHITGTNIIIDGGQTRKII